MHEHEAKKYVDDHISVTRQMVTLAKAYIIELGADITESEKLIRRTREHFDSVIPTGVTLHSTIDPIPTLDKAARAISWRVAACEAIWELIHSNLLVSASSDYVGNNPESLGWTTMVPGSGGNSSGWSFDKAILPVPRKIMRPPSTLGLSEQRLTNHDLYIHEIAINNMHPQIEEALREAVKCFRFELFSASVAMLGKASEGAWLELGAALLAAVPPFALSSVDKQKRDLENPNVGIGKKIDSVMTLYGRQDLFEPLAEKSDVRLQELRNAVVWSDAVRDSRNTIHFGVAPATPNTYEKVAAMLIGAVPHLRIIYAIKAAAEPA